jgi:crotonobetainyl-CoA:carnitine CoA-transferase CaiB-like acyl-CoA transferase
MIALHERNRSGLGQQVSGALLATAVALNNAPLIEQALAAPDRQAIGNRSFSSGPTDLFRTRDGWIAVHVVGQPLFRRWARLMRDEARWLDDPRFVDDISRGLNGAVLSQRMSDWCADKTRDEALDALAAAKIPAGPVLSPAEVLVHPQVAAMGLLQDVDYPGLPSPAPIAGIPVFLSRTPAQIRHRPPQLGEHTEEILGSLGYDAQAISDLRRLGTV